MNENHILVNSIEDPFVIVPREIINSKNLSFKAKALWGYLKDKPNGWQFSVKRIASQTRDGRDAILSGLKELEGAGLLVRTKVKDEQGQFCGTRYELVPLKSGFSDYGKSDYGKSDYGKSVYGNAVNISNTHNRNTHNRNTHDRNTQKSTTNVVGEQLALMENKPLVKEENGVVVEEQVDNQSTLVKEAFDIWEEIMGMRLSCESDRGQRRYAYNIMRRKDRGANWLRKMLMLLRSAKSEKYTSAKITDICDFKSLFYGVDILTQWGQSRADQIHQRKSNSFDLDNMD